MKRARAAMVPPASPHRAARAARLATFAATALLAAACAAREPPPAAPLSPTARYDGSYAGSAGGSCGSQQARITIDNGRFTLAVGPDMTLRGKAERDGSMSASGIDANGRQVNFSGHIEGNTLRGGSYNGRCAYAFVMDRRPG